MWGRRRENKDEGEKDREEEECERKRERKTIKKVGEKVLNVTFLNYEDDDNSKAETIFVTSKKSHSYSLVGAREIERESERARKKAKRKRENPWYGDPT